jgi:hypothetical protein
MTATPPNVIWKTPEEVDEIRLAADYRRLDRGEMVTQLACVLGFAPAPNRGHKIEPPPLEDEIEG